MKLIPQSIEQITFHVPEGYKSIEAWLEEVGRTCYKSEKRITETSAPKFIKMLKNRGHLSIFEHAFVSVRIISSRSMHNQFVRHRHTAFAQESTRYCNYSKDAFNGEIKIIKYPWLKETSEAKHAAVCKLIESAYLELLADGEPPELASAILPMSLSSEMVITACLTEWLHILNARCSTAAHPLIRRCALEILQKLNDRLPVIYNKQAEMFND